MELQGTDVDRFLRTLWAADGTDLLLTVGSPPMVRVDGMLRAIGGEGDLAEETVHGILVSVAGEGLSAKLGDELEVDFSFGWADVARVRGNAFRQRGNTSIALRVIPDAIPSFDELNLPSSVRNLAALGQGLVLFTGPTGSGKSTSLASLISWINQNRACHIITIEDPIEYVHGGGQSIVSQREVGVDTHSFDRALRAALREDPDVVLVGEMRDPESIAITLTLAETGHLVFSTLHTNDASQALDRIVDVFHGDRQPQIRLQLASVLSAVVAQRLVPKVGGGMVAAYEVLTGSSAVRNLVREGKTRQLRNVITTSRADGMQSLESALTELVAAGKVTLEDARLRALVPGEVNPPPGTPIR